MLNKAVKTLKKQKKIEYAEHCNIAVTEFLNGLLDSEQTTNNAETLTRNKKELEKMAYIKTRKDGRFEGVICFKGKYFSVYERDLNKLKTKITKKYKELEKEYKQIKTLAYTKKDWVTVEHYYNEWLENDKKPFVSEKTLQIIDNAFRNHILPKLSKV